MFIAPSDKKNYLPMSYRNFFDKSVAVPEYANGFIPDYSMYESNEPSKKEKNDEFFDQFWTDDMYKELLAKYKDLPWFDEQVLMQNPYLRSRQARFAPDTLSSWFNYEGKAAQYYSQMRSDAMSWLSDRLSELYQQYYNNPANQVFRQNAAGINSDLAGNIDPGQAAENDNRQPASFANGGETQEFVSFIGNAATTIVSTALNFVSGIQAMKGAGIDNAIKSLSLNAHLTGTATNLIKQGIGDYLSGNSIEAGTIKDMPAFVNSVVSFFDKRIDRLPYSFKERRKLKQISRSLIETSGESGQSEFSNYFQTLTNDSFKELFASRSGVTQAAGEIGSNKDTVAAMRFVADEIYKPFNEMTMEVNNAILRSQKDYFDVFNSYDKDENGKYIHGSSGGALKAKSEKIGYSLQADLGNVKKRITSAFEEINKKITGSRKLNPGWKIGLQAGVASVESMFMTQLAQGIHLPSGFMSTTTNVRNTDVKNYHEGEKSYHFYNKDVH